MSNKDIPVVIVAGGEGTRLRPLTNTLPKPMVVVDGLPILHHILNWFTFYGYKNFIFCLCYLPHVIQEYFLDGSKMGVNIEYVFEDPSGPLGSAGAVSLALPLLTGKFIVTYADILRKLNLDQIMQAHIKAAPISTIHLHVSTSAQPRSKVVFDPTTNLIEKFVEHPQVSTINEVNWSNGSLYIFEPEIKNILAPGEKADFGSDVFPKLIASGQKILAYPTIDYFIDISNLEKLQMANNDIKSGKFKPYDNN